MKTENLKEPPVSQWRVSIFWMIPAALIGGILLIVASFALVNWALPSEDAQMLKSLFGITIGGSSGGVAVSSAIGWVKRSLNLTDAKTQEQHFQHENERRCDNWGTDTYDPLNTVYNGRFVDVDGDGIPDNDGNGPQDDEA